MNYDEGGREVGILVMAGYPSEAAEDLVRRGQSDDARLAQGEGVLLSVLEGSSMVDDETRAQRVAGVLKLVQAIDQGDIEGGVVSFTRIEQPLLERSEEEVEAMLRQAGLPASMADERERVRAEMAIEPRTLIDTVIVGRDFAVARVSSVDDGVVVHESQHFVGGGERMTFMADAFAGAGSIDPDLEIGASRQTVEALELDSPAPSMVIDTRQMLAAAFHSTAEHRQGRASDTVVAAWMQVNGGELSRPISEAAAERAAAIIPPHARETLASLVASSRATPKASAGRDPMWFEMFREARGSQMSH